MGINRLERITFTMGLLTATTVNYMLAFDPNVIFPAGLLLVVMVYFVYEKHGEL